MACCYSRMGQADAALTCMRGCLEAGFEDYQGVRADKDLENMRRAPGFSSLMGEFENPVERLRRRVTSGGKDVPKRQRSKLEKLWNPW